MYPDGRSLCVACGHEESYHYGGFAFNICVHLIENPSVASGGVGKWLRMLHGGVCGCAYYADNGAEQEIRPS